MSWVMMAGWEDNVKAWKHYFLKNTRKWVGCIHPHPCACRQAVMGCLSVPVTNTEAAGGAQCHPQFLAVCQPSCSTGRSCLSPRGRHCLPEGSLTSPVLSVPPHRCHPALHTQDPAALGALGLPSHAWGRLQNQSVGLMRVVSACNALQTPAS